MVHSAGRFGFDPYLASRADPSRGGGTLSAPTGASTDPSFLAPWIRPPWAGFNTFRRREPYAATHSLPHVDWKARCA
jgi:hypothetical protein